MHQTIPRPLNFQTTVRDINRDQIARRFFPRMRPTLSGLGSPQFVNPTTGGLSGPEGYAGPMRPALDSYYPGGVSSYPWAAGARGPVSMPANVVSGAGGHAFIVYVNPDGTMGQSDELMQYTAGDTSFRAPSITAWQQAVSNLGFSALNAQWTSTYNLLVQQAKQSLAAGYPVATPIQTDPVTGAPYVAPSGGSSPAPSNGTTSLTFTDPSGRDLKNLQLPIGQNWVIKITGAVPNSPVSVSGTHNGVTNTNTMPTNTDASGNWQATGSTDSSTVGNWTESWSVGNQNVGSFMFSVNQNAPPIGGSQGSGSPLPGNTNTGATSGSGLPDTIGGINTTYVLMGGAALLLVMMMGGRR